MPPKKKSTKQSPTPLSTDVNSEDVNVGQQDIELDQTDDIDTNADPTPETTSNDEEEGIDAHKSPEPQQSIVNITQQQPIQSQPVVVLQDDSPRAQPQQQQQPPQQYQQHQQQQQQPPQQVQQQQPFQHQQYQQRPPQPQQPPQQPQQDLSVASTQNQAPPYRLFLNPTQRPYNVISSIYPDTLHIRQVQHLYDLSFPLNYSPAFYNSLANSKSQFQSQTLVLTSTNELNIIQPTLDSISSDSTSLFDQIQGPKITIPLINTNHANLDVDMSYLNGDDSKPSNSNNTMNDRITNLQVKLHESVLEPIQVNPLTSNPVNPTAQGDANIVPELLKQIANRYSADFTHYTLPEYINNDQQLSEHNLNSLDGIDSAPPPSTSYLHTASSQQYIASYDQEQNTTHQVLGSFVVRPSTQSVTSAIPDLIHTAKSTKVLSSFMGSVSSWFSGKEAPKPTPEELLEAYHPQLARSCYICTLAIAPQFTSTGLGSLLLYNCISFCMKNYAPVSIYLHVLESNKRAVRLYKSFGFVVESRAIGYFYSLPNSLLGAEPSVPLTQFIERTRRTIPSDIEIDDDSLALGLPLVKAPSTNTTDTKTNENVMLRSYHLPEDERGDALYMRLDIDVWVDKYKAIIVNWLGKKMNLTPK